MAEPKMLSNLQTLNLALATGFIVTCGDAVQAIWDAWHNPQLGGAGWPNVLLLMLLVSIGAKVAFDDHAALEKGKIQPFLAVDSTALVITYSIIIAATALIVDFYLSSLLLAGYLLALGVWNASIIAILCVGATPHKSIADFRNARGALRTVTWFRCLHVDDFEIRRVIAWMIIDFFGGSLLILFAISGLPQTIILGTVLAFLIVDLLFSESYGS